MLKLVELKLGSYVQLCESTVMHEHLRGRQLACMKFREFPDREASKLYHCTLYCATDGTHTHTAPPGNLMHVLHHRASQFALIFPPKKSYFKPFVPLAKLTSQ